MRPGRKRKQAALSLTLCVHGEMVPDNGEDSYLLEWQDARAIAAVFDGCGGAGARRYADYAGKTGAYMASRAVCGAVDSWFHGGDTSPEALGHAVEQALDVCRAHAGASAGLRGNIGKAFPTTAAIIVAGAEGAEAAVQCFWAGDSRCYSLDADGLHQLTLDDTDEPDALRNLTGDGVLTNLIHADGAFTLHEARLRLTAPCLLFSATDGCFGYIRTPMMFEYLIVKTLIEAESPRRWQEALGEELAACAGDDYSLCLLGCGYDSFAALQRAFRARAETLEARYIAEGLDPEAAWARYRTEYERWLPAVQA